MDYPEEKKETSAVVRIPSGLKTSIEEYLNSESAKKLGFRYISDVVNVAVRKYLLDIGYLKKVDISEDDYNVLVNYFKTHPKEMKELKIESPEDLLIHWIRMAAK